MRNIVDNRPPASGLIRVSRTQPLEGVPGWVLVDLGRGEASYHEAAVPRPGETHPHAECLYGRTGSVERPALEAFRPTLAVRPRAARLFRIDRHEVEHEAGRVLSAGAWCIGCGHPFRDERAAVGKAPRPDWEPPPAWWGTIEAIRGGVAKFCPACRNRQWAPERECAAPACDEWLIPTDARTVTCCEACRKRLERERRKHRPDYETPASELRHFDGGGDCLCRACVAEEKYRARDLRTLAAMDERDLRRQQQTAARRVQQRKLAERIYDNPDASPQRREVARRVLVRLRDDAA